MWMVPEVVDKWPRSHIYVMINIQQDNVGTHIKEDDPDFVADSRTSGLDITISLQPPKSPYLNVLDLG